MSWGSVLNKQGHISKSKMDPCGSSLPFIPSFRRRQQMLLSSGFIVPRLGLKNRGEEEEEEMSF